MRRGRSTPGQSRSGARTVALLAGALTLGGCEGANKPEPNPSALRQPSGLAMTDDGRWLFVTGGNFDQEFSNGVLLTVDLEAFHTATATALEVGDAVSASSPCRRVEEGLLTVECDPGAFIDPETTVLLGDALGNIVIDRPSGEDGGLRLLVTQRLPAAINWLDVVPGTGGVQIECGQDDLGRCDADHLIRRSPDGGVGFAGEPSRIFLDDQGYRFAYVPHLVDGSLSLIDLDGDRGPELTARADEFYREDLFDDIDIRGGFAVAGRACDAANPPAASRDCTRPLLYTTHRFWPGLREFSVAPGLGVILSGADRSLAPVGTVGNADIPPEAGEPLDPGSRPVMGDLEFEDPETGSFLLVVQTTPGALGRVDTRSGDDGEPLNEALNSVALCANPNILEVYRPEGEEALALVSCFSDARLAVVSLASFSVIASVRVGEGANEIVVDEARRVAYVANTRENSVSVVSLDRRSPAFLTEQARLGLGAGSRF